MATQSEPLRLMLGAVIAMREAGYTQEDVQEMAGEAWGYEGGGQPYAFGNCSNCGRVIIVGSGFLAPRLCWPAGLIVWRR